MANLLFILRECDCHKGKGLEGEFVYSWDGTELVLLPTNSLDYQESKAFSVVQGNKVTAKDMVPGGVYLNKNLEEIIYLGRLDYHYVQDYSCYPPPKKYLGKNRIKRHVFHGKSGFEFLDEFSSIKSVLSTDPHPTLRELVLQYERSPYGSKALELKLVDLEGEEDQQKRLFCESLEKPNAYVRWVKHHYTKGNSWGILSYYGAYCLSEVGIVIENRPKSSLYYSTISSSHPKTPWSNHNFTPQKEYPEEKTLVARLESGYEYKITELASH